MASSTNPATGNANRVTEGSCVTGVACSVLVTILLSVHASQQVVRTTYLTDRNGRCSYSLFFGRGYDKPIGLGLDSTAGRFYDGLQVREIARWTRC